MKPGAACPGPPPAPPVPDPPLADVPSSATWVGAGCRAAGRRMGLDTPGRAVGVGESHWASGDWSGLCRSLNSTCAATGGTLAC